MYILILENDDREIQLGIFDTLQNILDFIKLIPGYFVNEYGDHRIDLKNFPDYIEIDYLNNIVPLTKHMFINDDYAYIYFKELPKIDTTTDIKHIINYEVLVDSYYCNSLELKEYIDKRNKNIKIVKKKLEELSYEMDTSFRGSQDGEAIVYRKKGTKEWHFLTHLDPCFIENFDLNEILEDIIKG